MNEKTVAANIQSLAEQLNGEFKAAHELGLKVTIVTNWTAGPAPTVLGIRVTRETELLMMPISPGARIPVEDSE